MLLCGGGAWGCRAVRLCSVVDACFFAMRQQFCGGGRTLGRFLKTVYGEESGVGMVGACK
jgi:hypothetical protein